MLLHDYANSGWGLVFNRAPRQGLTIKNWERFPQPLPLCATNKLDHERLLSLSLSLSPGHGSFVSLVTAQPRSPPPSYYLMSGCLRHAHSYLYSAAPSQLSWVFRAAALGWVYCSCLLAGLMELKEKLTRLCLNLLNPGLQNEWATFFAKTSSFLSQTNQNLMWSQWNRKSWTDQWQHQWNIKCSFYRAKNNTLC